MGHLGGRETQEIPLLSRETEILSHFVMQQRKELNILTT